jgi:hypothetical protein
MRDRLRVVSTELPPRPEVPGDAAPKRRSVTLSTPQLFDEVMAGIWRWPDAEAIPQDERRLSWHACASSFRK